MLCNNCKHLIYIKLRDAESMTPVILSTITTNLLPCQENAIYWIQVLYCIVFTSQELLCLRFTLSIHTLKWNREINTLLKLLASSCILIISHSLIGTEPNWFSNIFFIHCFPVSIELCWGWFSLNMILWLTQPLTGDISHWSKHTAHPQNIVHHCQNISSKCSQSLKWEILVSTKTSSANKTLWAEGVVVCS